MDNMVRCLCIVQARLTSSRLPNKVLMELGKSGKSVLEHVYERLSESERLDKVIFAIPDSPLNDSLEVFLKEKEIPYFRGSEDDVLGRFYECAVLDKPEIIVRATCDNACVDWKCVDQLIDSLEEYDYVSSLNAPLGVGVEVFYAKALYKSYSEATTQPQHEHVTPYIYQHPELFNFEKIPYFIDVPNYRLTMDTEQDYKLINTIYERLYQGHPIENTEIYSFLNEHQELLELNKDVIQKTI